MGDTMIELTGDKLTATVDPFGAELTSLRDAEGRELMTDADPAYWAGHAPLLFPIVGRLNGDVLRIDGRAFTMKQHGFARRKAWEVVGAGVDAVTLRLRDDAETRAVWPFAFDIAVLYAIEEATLSCVVRVINTGDAPMPMSFGFHPAFAWPLPYGQPRAAHCIRFEKAEADAVVQLEGGLFAGERASPMTGQELPLANALFDQDALIWSPVASQSVLYGAEQGPQLHVEFPGAPDLGLWTKPGAAFICIEPWWGHADPHGFTGDIWDKPGIVRIEPDDERSFRMFVTLTD